MRVTAAKMVLPPEVLAKQVKLALWGTDGIQVRLYLLAVLVMSFFNLFFPMFNEVKLTFLIIFQSFDATNDISLACCFR